jgi:hypothetical protein
MLSAEQKFSKLLPNVPGPREIAKIAKIAGTTVIW